MLSDREIFQQYMGLPSSEPLGIEIKHAEGIYLYGKDEKKYIDLVSGVSVSNLGHNQPAIIRAIKEQAEKHTHLMVYGELVQSPQIRLAALLNKSLPEHLSCSFFVNSGSEAIEGALKLSKRYTGRSEIICFKNAYHGGTHGALSILGNEQLKYAFRPLLPHIRQLDFNNTDQLDQISENTACVVIEPIQAEAGIILPDEGYLELLRVKCNTTGTLLVFDEIQMGMGRTGKLFSFEHTNNVPDILCLAKAFGGGMPLGAFISSKRIMNSFTSNPELGHLTTFGGHPVSCAAALASLEILTEGSIIGKVDEKGMKISKYLEKHPEVANIRQAGLMLGIDLKYPEKMNELMKIFIKNGLIMDRFLFNEIAFRIAPPLVITDEEVDEVCRLVYGCLDEVEG